MEQNLRVASKLLEDFNVFLDKRSSVFVCILKDAIPKVLEWHYSIWEKEHDSLLKDDLQEEWILSREMSQTLTSLLTKIEERSLKEGHFYPFITSLKAHVEKYKEKIIKNEKGEDFVYIKNIIFNFYLTFVNNIKESPERYDIWEYYFPSEWKVSKENLENDNKKVSYLLLNSFIDWSKKRLNNQIKDEDWDEVLDDVALNLFPSVDPVLWSKILTFVFSSPTDNNRMKSLVERKRKFGFIGRIISSSSQDDSEIEKKWKFNAESQKKETLELALFLFFKHNDFQIDSLNDFISELRAMEHSYKENSLEEANRKSYIEIFEDLIKIKNYKKIIT